MHFFYLDEAGDTGKDLSEQSIFVLGGLSVSDEKWKSLEDSFQSLLKKFLGDKWNNDFELHTHEMRNRAGIWAVYSFEELNQLTLDIINLVIDKGHKIHFLAIDKEKMQQHQLKDWRYDLNPYFFGYEYILNYANLYIKNMLGSSARGIFVIDAKQLASDTNIYYETIKQITNKCRYDIPKAKRLKRIVEFTYPIDSQQNSMIQISDLIVYCIKKYFEFKLNRISSNSLAKDFYTECFNKIYKKAIWRKSCIPCDMLKQNEKNLFNNYIKIIGLFK